MKRFLSYSSRVNVPLPAMVATRVRTITDRDIQEVREALRFAVLADPRLPARLRGDVVVVARVSGLTFEPRTAMLLRARAVGAAAVEAKLLRPPPDGCVWCLIAFGDPIAAGVVAIAREEFAAWEVPA